MRVSAEIYTYIEKNGEKIHNAGRSIAKTLDILTTMFEVQSSVSKEVVVSKPVLGRTMVRDALIGLHIAMYHEPVLVERLCNESVTKTDEDLSDVLGEPVDVLRECLMYSYERALTRAETGEITHLRDTCMTYWRKGLMLPHLGGLARDLGLREGVPRSIAANALVPWILNIIKDMALGGAGAGSIAVMGAGIGLGKTSTIYHTLRSVLAAMGHPAPESIADKFLLLDPYDFLTALNALIEEDVKAPVLVVDNASALFPKQWVSMSGEIRKFFINVNMVINMLRASVGAVIFLSNGPEEIASFIRKNSTMNIIGEAIDIKSYTTTVYTWLRPTLSMRPGEESLRKRQRIASVYVFPLLKLPLTLYVRDLEVKKEVNRKKLADAVRSLRAALEPTAVSEAEQRITHGGYTTRNEEPEATREEENTF